MTAAASTRNDNPNPGDHGGCNNLPIATGADCKTTGGDDSLCATTNAFCTTERDCRRAPSLEPERHHPWLTSDATLGVGNTVVSPDFFEGGIDITQAFQGQRGDHALVLHHDRSRHAVLGVADSDAVRLRPQPARRAAVGAHDAAER